MWQSVEVTPPDELLEVQDEEGNVAKARPCYYPYKLKNTGRIYDPEVIHCDPYWDGSWLVELGTKIGNIIKWRKA